ncbi:MAG: hypothetical protein JWM80_3185, partial [Cyanobacteria bacterium RYN_339]|nr:hypothetical protein [Cyanobacteria bacterium RYN_339]
MSIQLPAFLRTLISPAATPRAGAPLQLPGFLRDRYQSAPGRAAAVGDDSEAWLPGEAAPPAVAPKPAQPGAIPSGFFPANPVKPAPAPA